MEITQCQGVYIPEHLTKDDNVRLSPGDTIRLETPGGGGYGNPLQRDVERVQQDVRMGYISPRMRVGRLRRGLPEWIVRSRS